MIEEKVMLNFNREKKLKFIGAIFIDLIGCISYLVPGFAEIIDVIWAPTSALLIFIMFKKSTKVAIGGALGGGIEEILAGFDFIPTATLVWVFVYGIEKEKTLKRYLESKKREEEIISDFQKKIEDK